MSAHASANDVDADGWIIPGCTCGWTWGMPCPDDETATDVLMDHAYNRGARDGRDNVETVTREHG